MYRLFPVLACFLFVPSILFADVVVLRNGARIEGKIVAQSRTMVRLRNANGIRSIGRGTIRRIVFGGYDPVAARKQEEARRKQQQEWLKKRQEAIRIQREAYLKQQELWRKQREEYLKKQQEAARKKQEAAQKQSEAERPRSRPKREPVRSRTGGDFGSLWSALLLPGLGQYRQGRPASGSLLSSGLVLGLAGTGYAASRLTALDARYRGLEEIINLMLIVRNENSGGTLDFFLSMERDRLGVQFNRNATGGAAALGLVGAIYLVNTVDLLLLSRGTHAAVRLEFTPGRAALAYEFRF